MSPHILPKFTYGVVNMRLAVFCRRHQLQAIEGASTGCDCAKAELAIKLSERMTALAAKPERRLTELRRKASAEALGSTEPAHGIWHDRGGVR